MIQQWRLFHITIVVEFLSIKKKFAWSWWWRHLFVKGVVKCLDSFFDFFSFWLSVCVKDDALSLSFDDSARKIEKKWTRPSASTWRTQGTLRRDVVEDDEVQNERHKIHFFYLFIYLFKERRRESE